jgi:integrase
VIAVLRSVLQLAVDDGLIAANPCARVKLPRKRHRVLEPLTADQVAALAEAMTGRYRVAIWLAAGAGLREGEALGLRTDRVDFLRRRIHVVEQLQNRELCELKTEGEPPHRARR